MNSAVVAAEEQIAAVVNTYREARFTRQAEIIAKLPVRGIDSALAELPEPLRSSMVSHVLRSAMNAAHGAKSDLDRWPDAIPEIASRSGVVITTLDNCDSVKLGTEMPVYTISPAGIFDAIVDLDGSKCMMNALDSLNRLGYSAFISQNLAVIVTLKKRKTVDVTSSWSTTAIRSTIYTDYYSLSELSGKDIVSEGIRGPAMYCPRLHSPADRAKNACREVNR